MNSAFQGNPIYLTGKEELYLNKVLSSRKLAGNGPFTIACQTWLEKNLQTPQALLTPSCTAALEMAAMLCKLQPGDEVIMPSFTFTSTANAFVLHQATPVFVDIDPQTLNISPQEILKAITPKTRAIVPVHYAGRACAMQEIMDIAEKYHLLVVEDNAQGICSEYQGKPLGSIGHFGCLSFHESKNIQCGEGGALLVNDESYRQSADIIREKGTNRTDFFNGLVNKYTWIDQGSSFLPSELNAAFLLAQLESAQEITQKKKQLATWYTKLLYPLKMNLQFMECNNSHEYNGHIFYIICQSIAERVALAKYLQNNHIFAFFHYIPLHSSLAGKKYGRTLGNLEVTQRISDHLLRLPMYPDMTEANVHYIAEIIEKFYGLH